LLNDDQYQQISLIEPPKEPRVDRHYELCLVAEKFLKAMGCGVVFRDGFRAYTRYGECPDAMGFRSNVSFLIEVKVSRSDFLADAKKEFRKNPLKGMGDWRFYLCPPGIIKVEDLPEGWGLLYFDGKRVKKVHGIPANGKYNACPFIGDKESELSMMYSALRRLVIRGHFEEIYDGLVITNN
jgi:hypothetical protein